MEKLLRDKRIYMVEDNLSNRAIMQMLLEQEGAKVIFESWGRNAVTTLKTFLPIDIILLDLMFPDGVSGFDIYDQIRKFKEFDNIPIVAVSASEPAMAIPKTRAKGFSGFIAKPIDYDLFPKQIYKLVNAEQVWQYT